MENTEKNKGKLRPKRKFFFYNVNQSVSLLIQTGAMLKIKDKCSQMFLKNVKKPYCFNIIRNISIEPNRHFRMIYEGSCDMKTAEKIF